MLFVLAICYTNRMGFPQIDAEAPEDIHTRRSLEQSAKSAGNDFIN
jgi:hypothetical protein